MTTASILITAWLAACIWPYMIRPRINHGSSLEDTTAFGGALLAGWVLIIVVSVLLLVFVA